ncbi:MAG: hypothetical protein HYU78_17835 [Rhodocyclales bacterium]|nr:hypothetical protein [Rhodocyclales bacterium]
MAWQLAGDWWWVGKFGIRYGRTTYSTASLGRGGRTVALRRQIGTRTLRRYVPSNAQLTLVVLGQGVETEAS